MTPSGSIKRSVSADFGNSFVSTNSTEALITATPRMEPWVTS